jgi:diguanylate cyclase (GGDEF)-like protein
LIPTSKYRETDGSRTAVITVDTNSRLGLLLEAYCSTLQATGKSAAVACPAPGRDLQRALVGLEDQLSVHATAEALKRTKGLVEAALERWGTSTALHLAGKADEVKELLILMARTAESLGERNQRYVSNFTGLTADLGAIANLDDLTQIRASLMKTAGELKSCVDEMAQDGAQSMEQLRSKVSVYENKIEVVEQLASKDPLTGLANRRGVEARMEWNIRLGRRFCVAMLDLNLFKSVNDRYGHVAGDNLLKQFAVELQKNVRHDDLVGRWGGDEFILVLSRDLNESKALMEGVRQWGFGEYMIETGTGKGVQKISVAAAVGLAEWETGNTFEYVVEQADAAMYRDKKENYKKKR